MDQNEQRKALKHIQKIENVLQDVLMEPEKDATIQKHLDALKEIVKGNDKPSNIVHMRAGHA